MLLNKINNVVHYMVERTVVGIFMTQKKMYACNSVSPLLLDKINKILRMKGKSTF